MVSYWTWLEMRWRLGAILWCALALHVINGWQLYWGSPTVEPRDLSYLFLVMTPFILAVGGGLSPTGALHHTLTLPVARWRWIMSRFAANFGASAVVIGSQLVLAQAVAAVVSNETTPWDRAFLTNGAALVMMAPLLAAVELANMVSGGKRSAGMGFAFGILSGLALAGLILSGVMVWPVVERAPGTFIAGAFGAGGVILMLAVRAAGRREYR